MKKLIFTLSLFCFIAAQSNAQYCGGSGPSVCEVAILNAPGLSPVSDSLPPIFDGVATATTIHFQNYDTLTFQGTSLTMDSLTVVSISNLPTGLCWATNKPTNTFANQENGCIQVTGTTNAAPGQYKLDIIVKAYTSLGLPLTTSADAAGLHYYVRVRCDAAESVHSVDTTQTAADSIILYTDTNLCHNVGIKQVDDNIQALSVYPNPFNNNAEVKFTSAKAGMMTEKIVSIIGSTVYSNQLSVVVGENTTTINRNNLASGVYFYTLTDGVSTFSKKLVITE